MMDNPIAVFFDYTKDKMLGYEYFEKIYNRLVFNFISDN